MFQFKNFVNLVSLPKFLCFKLPNYEKGVKQKKY